MLQPDQAYERIADIPIDGLAEDGYNTVIFDRDHVLIDENGYCDDEHRAAYDAINNQFNTCILTNETLRYDGDAEPIARRFETNVIDDTAPKPDKEGFKAALECLDADPDETVYVGDSPVTDIYGANKMGLTSIQVDPYGSYEFPLSVSKPFEQGIQQLEAVLTHLFPSSR